MRHPPVASAWSGRCYGRSDPKLGREGRAMAAGIVGRLADRVDLVVHSGARRASALAVAIAHCHGCPIGTDPDWLERDFGTWEGRTWNAIWRETGDLMDSMVTDPERFRPGGGETGLQLSVRATAAWLALPCTGNVVVVTHGGPIAAVRTALAGAPLGRMSEFIPALGEIVRL